MRPISEKKTAAGWKKNIGAIASTICKLQCIYTFCGGQVVNYKLVKV